MVFTTKAVTVTVTIRSYQLVVIFTLLLEDFKLLFKSLIIRVLASSLLQHRNKICSRVSFSVPQLHKHTSNIPVLPAMTMRDKFGSEFDI